MIISTRNYSSLYSDCCIQDRRRRLLTYPFKRMSAFTLDFSFLPVACHHAGWTDANIHSSTLPCFSLIILASTSVHFVLLGKKHHYRRARSCCNRITCLQAVSTYMTQMNRMRHLNARRPVTHVRCFIHSCPHVLTILHSVPTIIQLQAEILTTLSKPLTKRRHERLYCHRSLSNLWSAK